MKKVLAILMAAIFCMTMLSSAVMAADAAQPAEAEAPVIAEGESPEAPADGESAEAPAEGESAEGESAEGEAAEGESAEGESGGASAGGSGGSASPMQELILTEETVAEYEHVNWSGEGGYLALLGATAYVGGDEDNFPVENVLVPVSQEYYDASALQFDGSVNSVFMGTQDATGGGATFNVTGEGSQLYVNNAYITSQGSQTAAMYVDETNNKVVVKDSYLESYGSVPGYEDVTDFIALQGLLSWGHTRTNLSQGVTSTYYYNSAVVADGWAAMSTDGATGLGVNFVAVNSYAETADGGYAIYSDHECRDYVFGTTLVGAEYGAIIAAGGELYLMDGDAFDLATTELNGWRQAFMDANPAQLMETSYQDFAGEHPVIALEEYNGEPMDVGRTTIVGGRNCVLMHKPDEGHEGLPAASQNVLYADGVDFIVDEALFDLNDMPEGWYTPEDVTSSASFFNDDTLNYVYFTSGAAILMRSCSTLVRLNDVTYTNNYGSTALGYDDLFLLAVINSDGNANLIADGDEAAPMDIVVSNSEISGNIADMDYQREMLLTFDNSTLNGWIKWLNVDGWNEIWGADGILGTGAYAYDEAYETVWGPCVTLKNGAVWNVTEESYVKSITADDTSVVNGVIEEYGDGFLVKPLEGAAPAEGESEGGLALQTEEYEITVGDVTAMAYYEDLAADSEKRAFKITFEGQEYTGTIDKGVWTADDPAGAEVIAAYQAAHEADPNFQGAPGGDSEGGESAEGESAEGAAPAEGESPEGESPEGEAPAEGESPEGESAEGEAPAEGESAEGGSEGGLALQTEEYEITVGDVTAMAYYEDLAADSEKRAFKITFDGQEYTGNIDKGVWTADDPAGAEVIAAYQAAHEADPNFQGAPGGDSEGGESPEAEAPAAGDTSEEAYHAYLKEYVAAVPAVSEDQYQDFYTLIDASDYTTMPADMLFNPQWWGYSAMTYDEFVAANGVYEIPEFDPNLTAD